MTNQYQTLTKAAVAVIYASIPREVLEGDTGMHDKFMYQISSAKQRGIPMELTREEWCAIWWLSGKWFQRGKGINNYQMCRKNDEGSYSMGNVRIDTKLSNLIECGSGPKPFIATSIATGEEFYCESSICDQMKELNLDRRNVSKCLLGKFKQHNGFTFRYAQ